MDKFKVFLVGITGSSTDIQLAVFVLKATLLKSGMDVDIKVGHYNRIPQEELFNRCTFIAQEIIRYFPQVVGFSVYTWNLRACLKIAELVHWTCPEIKIVFGGPEASENGYENVDQTICGEGELPFTEYVRSVIYGASYSPLETKELKCLDDSPSPYLTRCIPDELLSRPGIKAVIETQRGCNFRCAYCRYHSNFPTIRYRNIDTVILESLYAQKVGASSIRFSDGNFLSDRNRATKIINALTVSGVNIPIFFEVTPSFVTSEFVDAIKKYPNTVTIGIGLQSVNPDALRIIHRPTSLMAIQRAYGLLSNSGATIITDVILGLPKETKETFIDTLKFMIEVMRNPGHILAVSLLRILPDTDMVKIAEDEHLTIAGEEHFVQSTPTMPRRDLIYCASLTAAAYRTLNSDYRDKLYSSSVDPFEFIQKVAKRLHPKNNLEGYWLFDVFNEISDKNLEKIENEC